MTTETYHAKTTGYWNSVASHYPKNGKVSPLFEEFYTPQSGHIRDALDIGCGLGTYIIYLARNGVEATGIEPSESRRRVAEDRIAEAGLQASVIRGYSHDLALPEDAFDLIVSKGAIHHNTWPYIEKSFAEAARVLRPDGYFFFQGRSARDTTEPRRRIPDKGFTAIDTKGKKKGVVQHYFTNDELLYLAHQSQLEIFSDPAEKIERLEDGRDKARWWAVFQKKVA